MDGSIALDQMLGDETAVIAIYREDLIANSAFVAANATVLGEVEIRAEASVWFGCVLRGDNEPITVGERSNVQDLTVIHTDEGIPCVLGTGVTIGHRAVVHSATVGNGALIGIGAILLNGATVEEKAMVGAGALVTEGQVVPARHLAIGVPAKVVRELTDREVEMLDAAADHYVVRAAEFRKRRTKGGS